LQLISECNDESIIKGGVIFLKVVINIKVAHFFMAHSVVANSSDATFTFDMFNVICDIRFT